MFKFVTDLTIKLIELKNKRDEKKIKQLEKENQINKESQDNKELQETNKQKSKIKSKKIILFLLKWLKRFVDFMFDFFKYVLMLIGPIGIGLVISVLLILLVVLFLFQNLDFDNLNSDKNDNVTPPISGNRVTAQWSESELAVRGVLLDETEKNYYRLIMLARRTVNGTYGTNFKFTGDIALDTLFLTGISSTETSMRFYSNANDTRNILEYPSDVDENNLSYGMFGISASKKLDDYVGTTTGDKIRSMYTYKETPLTHARYAPWGVAMSGKHISNDLAANIMKSSVDSVLEEVMTGYGIVSNREKLKNIGYWVLAQAQYHGAAVSEYKYYFSFLCAMWAASSDIDSERDISKWDLVPGEGNEGNFSESAYRHVFVGAEGAQDIENTGDFTNMVYKSSSSTRISLNGVTLSKPLWGYLHDKYKENSYFMEAENKMLEFAGMITNSSGAGKGARVLNFHYGINSYLQGKRLVNVIESKLTGGTGGVFIETPGVGQGVWGGKTIDELILGNDKALKFKPYWGTSYDISTGEMLEWRESTSFKSPFYYQQPDKRKDYMPIKVGYIQFYNEGNTYTNGCGFYMSAYIASALSGKLINTAEMGSALFATGGVTDLGLMSHTNMPKTYDLLGIKFSMFSEVLQNNDELLKIAKDFDLTVIDGSNAWENRWNYIDELLREGGIVGVTVSSAGPFTSSGHYMAIIGKDEDTGLYQIYTSSRPNQVTQLWKRSDFDGKLRTGRYFFAKRVVN